MKLKIADTDHVVNSTEKWYRIATDYKLSIGILRNDQALNKDFQQAGTGFLALGQALHKKWKDRVVFLTAAHVVGELKTSQKSSINIGHFSAIFPALNSNDMLKFDKVLFYSSEIDFAVLAISGERPQYTEPIKWDTAAAPVSQLEGVAVLHWTSNDGFSLGFGHGIAPPDREIPRAKNRLYYTHVTGPGASGAPVFSTETGELVCLHQMANPRAPRPWGSCTTLTNIVAAIAADEATKR